MTDWTAAWLLIVYTITAVTAVVAFGLDAAGYRPVAVRIFGLALSLAVGATIGAVAVGATIGAVA